mmetsp:Transcript_81867/g.228094  ORF Transcript_81867/g.228094 Transcript_81867/m.228094 type:complete len:336 (-) Transcript_81867:1306-2313(-)
MRQVVVTGRHCLEELDVVDCLGIRLGHDEKQGSRHILDREMVPGLPERFHDLRGGHCLLVRHVAELLEELREGVDLLVDHVSEPSCGVAHQLRFHPLLGLSLSPRGVIRIERLIERRLSLHHRRGIILVQQRVAELVVAHLAVLALVEMLHEYEDLLVRELEAILFQRLLEFGHCQHTVVVCVEPPEHVAHERELLAHALAQLLEDSAEVISSAGVGGLNVIPRVFVHVQDLELPVVHLNDSSRIEVLRFEQLASVLIEMHRLLEVFPCDDANVSLRWLMNRQRVVEKVEIDHEQALCVLWLRLEVLRCEAEHLAVVVIKLLEVLLRRLRDQVRH